MKLPEPRGRASGALLKWMSAPEGNGDQLAEIVPDSVDDEQIALWSLYSLHESGFTGVPEEMEWRPALLAMRARMELGFVERLRSRWLDRGCEDDQGLIANRIFALVEAEEGPSLAAYVDRHATIKQVHQLLKWRSLYHLREADPSTWVIPRLRARPKAALVELQFDEYGAGNPARLHSNLFAKAMEACGLDADLGAYVDEAPVEVLELNNAMSLFGLHRSCRGAAMGHLAAFEATSSLPSRRISRGLHRLGLPDAVAHYYEEHIEADAVHEQLAARDICGAMVAEDAGLADQVMFGAFTCVDLERRFATRALNEWDEEGSHEYRGRQA